MGDTWGNLPDGMGARARTYGGRASMTHGIAALTVGGIIAFAFLAGCGDGAAPEPVPTSDGAGVGAEVPMFRLVGVPEGFEQLSGTPNSEGWQDVLRHSDGCSVETRGELLDAAVNSARDASTERLEALASADGAMAGQPAEEAIPTEESVGDVEPPAVMFVVDDWVREDNGGSTAVRTAVRVATGVTYEGDADVSALDLRMKCPGDVVPDVVWDAALGSLRPIITGVDAVGRSWS